MATNAAVCMKDRFSPISIRNLVSETYTVSAIYPKATRNKERLASPISSHNETAINLPNEAIRSQNRVLVKRRATCAGALAKFLRFLPASRFRIRRKRADEI